MGGERAPGRGLGLLAPAGPGGQDAAVWAWTGPLASWVDPDKCPVLSGPPVGKARALEPLRHVRRRGLKSEPEAGASPLTGTWGSLLNLWGHSPGQQGQSCRDSPRKLAVLRKIPGDPWVAQWFSICLWLRV